MPESLSRGSDHPVDPTVAQIAVLLAESYLPEGVVVWLNSHRAQVGTAEGRRQLYDKALALAEGVFS